MIKIKTFKQLFENKDDDKNVDFILSRLNTKLNKFKQDSKINNIKIKSITSTLKKNWLNIYDTINLNNHDELEYENFKKNYDYGKLLKNGSIMDFYSDDVAHIKLYENYIVYSTHIGYFIFITEEENLRLNFKKYNI